MKLTQVACRFQFINPIPLQATFPCARSVAPQQRGVGQQLSRNLHCPCWTVDGQLGAKFLLCARFRGSKTRNCKETGIDNKVIGEFSAHVEKEN